ncbi:L-threonylcarbamoyladenylate synthase, partial [Roseovarius sp. SYSU LYC5161]|uniref:L-threonylcarbamoyladenylate synthase n=1 Tax=Roseovarius halophilus (ex Wu et al. 2025) TaxID=3376060 RepID=UPI00399C0163
MTAQPAQTKTEPLTADAAGLDRAAALLAAGGLVAIPTETVYGLAVDATDDDAVARLYQAKGRPAFNPLIVHVADVDQARALVEMAPGADRLAQAFWPGALTLVLPLRDGTGISPLVTAGLEMGDHVGDALTPSKKFLFIYNCLIHLIGGGGGIR